MVYKDQTAQAVDFSGQELSEFAEPRLVVAPARDRGRVDRLSCLPIARSLDDASVALRVQACLVRIETAKYDHISRQSFPVGDQRLVIVLQEAVAPECPTPMCRQAQVLLIEENDVASVTRKIFHRAEISKVD